MHPAHALNGVPRMGSGQQHQHGTCPTLQGAAVCRPPVLAHKQESLIIIRVYISIRESVQYVTANTLKLYR